jgi:hypothetical protein
MDPPHGSRPVFLLPLAFPKDLDDTTIFIKNKRLDQITKYQLYRSLVAVALLLQGSSVWQGFHLLNSGYNVNILQNASPSELGSAAARGRGKGGVILFIIQYFPLFLIGGYSWLAKETYDLLVISNRRIETLEMLSSLSSSQQDTVARAISKLIAEKGGSGEYWLDPVIKAILKSERENSQKAALKNDDITQKYPEKHHNRNSRYSNKPIAEVTDSTEKALERLVDMKSRGVITEQEYNALRNKELGL